MRLIDTAKKLLLILEANDLDGGLTEESNYIKNVSRLLSSLKPRRSSAPAWAQWYAIDSTGIGHWFKHEPEYDVVAGTGVWCGGVPYTKGNTDRIPHGVHPQDCVWSINELEG